MPPRGPRIALLHYADVENYGDVLFPLLTAHELRSRLPSCEVTYVSATGVGPAPALRYDQARLAEFDALVLAGGEIVHRNDEMYHQIYARFGRTAIPHPTDLVFGWSNLAGPYKAWVSLGVPVPDPATQRSLRAALPNLDFVVARSQASAARLRAAGAQPRLAPDLGWLFSRLLVGHRPSTTLPQPPYVTFHAFPQATPPDLRLIVEPLQRLERAGLRVVLVPLTTCWGDEGPLGRIGALGGFQVLDYRTPVLDKLRILAGSTAYLGQSMHGFVTTLACGRPAGLCYPVRDDKFSALLADQSLSDLRVAGWDELPSLCERVLATPPARVAAVRAATVPQVDTTFDDLAERILRHVAARTPAHV